MIPVISRERINLPGGLWAPKVGGDLQEGDLTAKFTITGRMDIRELGGLLRLFATDIKLIQKKITLTEKEKKKISDNYHAVVKKLRREEIIKAGGDPDEEEILEDDEEERREMIAKDAIAKLIYEEENKKLPVPKLSVYLQRRKPKTKMVGPHKTGSRIHLTTNRDGLICANGTLGSFETSLKDIPDALMYGGITIVKLPSDEPKTEDALIYAVVKFSSLRSSKHKTSHALHIAEINDVMLRILEDANLEMPGENKEEERKKKRDEDRRKKKEDAKKSQGGGWLSMFGFGNKPLQVVEEVVSDENKYKVAKWIKPNSFYTDLTKKAWQAFNLESDAEIKLPMIMDILAFSNIALTLPQATRLFKAVDLSGNGELSQIEFENMLMCYDVIGPASPDLLCLDVFDSLKFKNSAELSELGNHDGIDFVAFKEGCSMLGMKPNVEDKEIIDVFLEISQGRNKDPNTIYISYDQFKRGWLKLADLEAELNKRKLKFDPGVMAANRNRDRIYRILTDQESNYENNLKLGTFILHLYAHTLLLITFLVNEIVDHTKRIRRQKKDDHKRDREAHETKLHHDAEKFVALRSQETRLMAKNEKDEKSRKRLDERGLRQNLLQRQKESKDVERQKIKAESDAVERLRIDEIKAQGLDRLDMSVGGMRYLPESMYDKEAAQTKLSYLLLADFSKNILEVLPEKNFFYWMSDLRKLKLSLNRLKRLPEEMEKLISLEILELDGNKLETLPTALTCLTKLQRLDISNNIIHELPVLLSPSLKYFCGHSNKLHHLPTAIGACFRLEYLDLSHNSLRELPEDFEHLVSLTHLDLSMNHIGQLPLNFGCCNKLVYLDLSTNYITGLPLSFSKLENLTYFNLQNNEAISHPNTFDSLSMLKKLLLRRNHMKHIYGDIGNCKQLTFIDASDNKISDLPAEIGLLSELQELILHRNYLEYIPPELGMCKALQKLELPYNNIKGCLPETIGLIESLRWLDISRNNIDELPESVIGLTQIVHINAERCSLSRLPVTITTLKTLEILDMPNNRFTKFPIELSLMVALKTLNLRDNSITLLPRTISRLTNITTLDISKNQLRALPVEFVSLFETVPNVYLNDNPWTDLPPKWGRLWPGTTATEGPYGYNIPDTLDFLYGMRTFYDVADGIWQDTGVYHYTGRLSFVDFIEELKRRMPKSWHDGLVEYVKYIYFASRETGVYPRWYALDDTFSDSDSVLKENNRRLEYDKERRDQNVANAKRLHEERLARTEMAYNIDLVRRTERTAELRLEQGQDDAYIGNMATVALHHVIEKKQEKVDGRLRLKAKMTAKYEKDEIERMKEIIEADQEYVVQQMSSEEKQVRENKKKKGKTKIQYLNKDGILVSKYV